MSVASIVILLMYLKQVGHVACTFATTLYTRVVIRQDREICAQILGYHFVDPIADWADVYHCT